LKIPLKYLLGAFLVLSATVVAVQAFRKPPRIRQPIAFPHQVHVANQMECGFCHDSAERSSVAGIPSVTQCMVCHQSIKTDSPEVKKLASYAGRNQEVPWAPVYFFPVGSAVYFSHKRHVKAGVECRHCHGNVAESMEMRREIDWTMGKCIDCHRTRKASIDCLTCHM
jgi:Cytochrome c7 and related cytochrome c/Class III cytochrome C family